MGLPQGYTDFLKDPANQAELDKFVLNHIIVGNAISPTFESGQVENLDGESLEVEVSGGEVTARACGANVKVNGSVADVCDNLASNGAIHVMTEALIPPSHVDKVAEFAAVPGTGAPASLYDIAKSSSDFSTLGKLALDSIIIVMHELLISWY